MATIVLKPDLQLFPAGTSVDLYFESAFPTAYLKNGLAPAGAPIETAVVADDGTLTFALATAGARHVAYTDAPRHYIRCVG